MCVGGLLESWPRQGTSRGHPLAWPLWGAECGAAWLSCPGLGLALGASGSFPLLQTDEAGQAARPGAPGKALRPVGALPPSLRPQRRALSRPANFSTTKRNSSLGGGA